MTIGAYDEMLVLISGKHVEHLVWKESIDPWMNMTMSQSHIGPIWMLKWHICNAKIIAIRQMKYFKNWSYQLET
jgi:hypothetical protein